MCKAFRTSGAFRYTLMSVELVQGGSILTLLRATGIRNRFWESQERPCHNCLRGWLDSAPSRPPRTRAAPGLTCLQENLIGMRMKELPRSCVMR